MNQSTETEQLKSPQLRGTITVVMKSGSRDDDDEEDEGLIVLLKTLSFDFTSKLVGGSIGI